MLWQACMMCIPLVCITNVVAGMYDVYPFGLYAYGLGWSVCMLLFPWSIYQKPTRWFHVTEGLINWMFKFGDHFLVLLF